MNAGDDSKSPNWEPPHLTEPALMAFEATIGASSSISLR